MINGSMNIRVCGINFGTAEQLWTQTSALLVRYLVVMILLLRFNVPYQELGR